MSSDNNAETFSITQTETEDGLMVNISGSCTKLLQIPLSEKKDGDNLSKQGIALWVQTTKQNKHCNYEPEQEVTIPPCKHRHDIYWCLSCNNGPRVTGDTVTDCPFAARKAKENIILSYLAEVEQDGEAAAKLKAWLEQKQAEGQVRAEAAKAKEVKE